MPTDIIRVGNHQFNRKHISDVQLTKYQPKTYIPQSNDMSKPADLHADDVTRVARVWLQGQMPHMTFYNEDADEFMRQWQSKKVTKRPAGMQVMK